MASNILPKDFPQFEESIYAGFGIRIGALLLDILILAPIFIGLSYIEGMSHQMHFIVMPLTVALALTVNVLLVKLYGATPGKYIAGIKIVKLDGTNVGWNEAVLRYFVDFCLMAFGLYITHMAIMSMSDAAYQELTFMTRGMTLQATNPLMFQIQGWFSLIWMLSEYIVLLTNKRRQAFHDFIANTLVIKSKYQHQVLEINAQEAEKVE